MNKYQGEVPFDVFDEQGFIEEISSYFEIFSEPMQLMIHESLKYAVNKRDFWYIQEWLLRPDIWKMPMVSLDTFIDSPQYLNKPGNIVYKKVRDICREIIEGNYREAVEVAGIGCERLGTKIIMSDGTIKPNTEIEVGDFLMGPDGTPRKVLQKHSGIDDMYEIIPYKGENKYVTKEHKLHLKAFGLKKNIKTKELIKLSKFDLSYHRLMYQNGLTNGIQGITYIGKEEYIGFKIDGDELYMWEDFTITHNSGKSYKSTILATYVIQMLLCLRNPFTFYGLDGDKPIAIMNMAPTSTQALAVVFTGLKAIVEGSPFFKQFQPVVQAAQIKFEKEKILMVSGNSKATTPLGYNVFCAILDEAAFFLNNDETDAAEEVYQSLNRRIASRFNGSGIMIVISSPKYVGDFITQKILQARRLDKNGNKEFPDIFSVQLASWKSKGSTRCTMEGKIFVDVRKKEILNMSENKIIKEGRKINYAFGGPITEDYDVWEVPGNYAPYFKENVEKAMRDFGAQASENIEGFFPNPAKVTNMFNLKRPDPVVSPGVYKFPNRPIRTPYYIHLDLGFNRDGKGDHTGISMCHFGGWVKEEGSDEYKMNIVVDLVEQIGINGDTGEVDMSEVRQRIYDLKDLGFNIRLVTFDQFASKDFSQILNKKGFRTDLLSVDRTVDPYNTLKELIYDDRLDIYYSNVVETELKGLELVKGSKVDHRQNGSKDLTDALCGAVYNVISHTPKSNISVRNVVKDDSVEAKKLQAFRERSEREKYYEKLEKQVQRQMEIQDKVELIQQNILDRQSNKLQFYK